MIRKFYKILDNAWVYRLQGALLAPGYQAKLTENTQKLLKRLPHAQLILDVGCGPSSNISKSGISPIGLDLSWFYVREYIKEKHRAVVASAELIPFSSQSFDGIWSIGLFHHLPKPLATATIAELIRICKPGGYIVIFAAVLPRSVWRRPLATLLRRLDRGRYMRSQEEVESLLSLREKWSIERQVYSYTGLEWLICRFVKK
jgi:SAM-dependent methyltransferase